MAATWSAGARGFSAGNVASLSTAAFSISGSGKYLRVLNYSGAGTPANVSTCVWDSAGVNEALSSLETAVTFNTNFRGSVHHLVGPSNGTNKVVTTTWASNQDETMVLADAYTGVDQSTPNRTLPTATTGTSTTPSINVTSVSGDLVVGSACAGMQSTNLTTVTSSTLTVREKVEGADIGNHESCGQGDVTASGTSTTASFTLGIIAGTPDWLMFGAALIPASGSAPAISSVSDADPQIGATLTITGTAFGASQGSGSVTIGGVAQTVTSWADTSIDVTVVRGTNKFGTAVNVVVTDNALSASSPFALTGLLPITGWSYVNLSTPAAPGSNRLTATPDLASGDQVSWDTVGAGVTVNADATFVAVNTVTAFAFEVWTPGDGWGAQATQEITGPVILLVRPDRKVRTHSKLWRREGWINTRLHRAGWFNKDLILPASAALAATVNQVTETDTAQPITARHLATLAQVVETDTAQAIAVQRVLALAQVTETDSAQAVTPSLVASVGQVLETDTAQAISARLVGAVAQVLETDTAQAVTASLGGTTVNQVNETDTAQPITARLVGSVAQALETDTAQSIAARLVATVAQALETDTAQPITARQLRTVVQVTETDTAQDIAAVVPGGATVAQVIETDSAQPITARQLLALGQVTETDSAQPIVVQRRLTLAQVLETDSAQAISVRLVGSVGQVLETDSAQTITPPGTTLVGQVTETDTAQPLQLLAYAAAGARSQTSAPHIGGGIGRPRNVGRTRRT